ncbi:MAG: cupin domain-containing protein [Armatimonadota bacterium]|nr:cupin domain-containing protein [Armatimonadota bacterium]
MKRSWMWACALAVVFGGAAAVGAQVGMTATTVLQATTTAIGQPIQFPQGRNQFAGVLIELAPGGEVGRHLHPFPNYVYVLEGEITIETDGHEPRTYRAGESFAESVNTWHNGINRGTRPLRVLVVFAGEDGKAVTVRP